MVILAEVSGIENPGDSDQDREKSEEVEDHSGIVFFRRAGFPSPK